MEQAMLGLYMARPVPLESFFSPIYLAVVSYHPCFKGCIVIVDVNLEQNNSIGK